MGRPWPCGANSPSMARFPLRNACARPAQVAFCAACAIGATADRTRFVGWRSHRVWSDPCIYRQARHRRSRRWCSPSEGVAEPGSEAGRRASAAGPGTAHRRGPVDSNSRLNLKPKVSTMSPHSCPPCVRSIHRNQSDAP
jgi:hypothetical protein